LEQLNNPIGKL